MKPFKKMIGEAALGGGRFKYILWFKAGEQWWCDGYIYQIEFNMNDKVYDGFQKDIHGVEVMEQKPHSVTMGGYRYNTVYQKIYFKFSSLEKVIEFVNYINGKTFGCIEYKIDKDMNEIANEFKVMII